MPRADGAPSAKKPRLDDRRFAISFSDVEAAHTRLRASPKYRRTPVLRSTALEEVLERLVGRRVELFFKCEHLQATGSFKIRGALNALLSLPDEVRCKGVVTHSSGNHGQALALAANLCGVAGTVVIPTNAPPVKVSAIRAYGAKVVFCEPNLNARLAACEKVVAETGATVVPPYDHETVMAGQGTCGLEMVQDIEAVDAIVIPVSGGGLISGCTVAAKGASDGKVLVFGAEPLGADDAAQSKQAGKVIAHSHPPSATFCDALRINRLGDLCWPVIRDLVEDILVVPDGQCTETMRLIYERMKQVVEPSGAVATASLFTPGGVAALRSRPEVKRVGVLLCGGNLDLMEPMPWAPRPSDDFARACRLFRTCYDEVLATIATTEGRVYSTQKIDGLSDQSPALFGAALALPDGRRFECGDSDVVFQLQSTFKPLVYGFALKDFGCEVVHKLVGASVSLGGFANQDTSFLPDGRPYNPLINAGALRLLEKLGGDQPQAHDLVTRVTALLPSADPSNSLLVPDEVALRQTKEQQSHNMSLCKRMDVKETSTCDLYASLDSMRSTCRALSCLGAKLANGELFGQAHTRSVRAVMMSCGMYEESPIWAVCTGLPAKSGVSGVVLGAGTGAPGLGQFGVCVFAPPLDAAGNSVRAQALVRRFCERLSV